MVYPIDIEDALRIDLTHLYEVLGITDTHFSAAPLPATISEIPQEYDEVLITHVGGNRNSLVLDTFSVSIDTYSGTWDKAISAANRVASLITNLPYLNDTVVQYHSVNIATLPYELPDAIDPIWPRVRMLITLVIKADIREA